MIHIINYPLIFILFGKEHEKLLEKQLKIYYNINILGCEIGVPIFAFLFLHR